MDMPCYKDVFRRSCTERVSGDISVAEPDDEHVFCVPCHGAELLGKHVCNLLPTIAVHKVLRRSFQRDISADRLIEDLCGALFENVDPCDQNAVPFLLRLANAGKLLCGCFGFHCKISAHFFLRIKKLGRLTELSLRRLYSIMQIIPLQPSLAIFCSAPCSFIWTCSFMFDPFPCIPSDISSYSDLPNRLVFR